MKSFLKGNTSLTVIISAVLLLELMMGLMFYQAQNFIQRTMERMVGVEMNAIYLCIRNKLANAEVTVDNMSWVVGEALDEPDWMLELSHQMVKNNPIFWGSGVVFEPNYYPSKGKFFVPYSVRGGTDSIVSLRVDREKSDFTQKEYYRIPVEQGISHWSEPYENAVGPKSIITTYSTPVRDKANRIVGVIVADISTDLLEEVMNEEKIYKSTQRFLVTGNYNLLAGQDSPIFREILELVKADKDKSEYLTMTTNDGKKHHVFYTLVGGKTDWILINILDDNEVFGRLRMMRSMLMLPLVLGLLFAWFIVWRSSRNLKRFHKVNAEKERIDSELHVASQIQQNMLPKQFVRRDDVDIHGSLVPAREVGGDLFDYYIRDEKLFFCIGDVSGKGAPSAMVMGVVHSLFRAFSAHENNPAHIMQSVNEASCKGNDSNIFVTMFIGVLDLPTGNLRYCDAGHDSPLIIENGNVRMEEFEPHLPIGVFEDTKYEIQETVLAPNSTLFLYTDGLTEAKKGYKQYFGIERVKEVLAKCAEKDLTPSQILEIVTEEVHQYVGDAEQSDDLTMLAIHYTPHQFESKLADTLSIKNDVHDVLKLNQFQKAFYAQMDIDKSLARQLQLAVEEAVVNVIDYAYPIGTDGDITINMMSDDKYLKIIIIDSGVVFDPTLKGKTDTTLSAEDRQIGGLGIHLVRELMDSINYEREGGKNVLTLIKNLKNH